MSWLRLQSKELQIAFNVWSISVDNLKAVERSGGVVWNGFKCASVS